MSTTVRQNDTKQAQFALAKGSSCPVQPPFLKQYSALDKLYTSIKPSTYSPFGTQPLPPTSVEMLEAELQNQHILPKSKPELLPISYRIQHNISFLRWRAIGSGLHLGAVEFRVDLTNYIIQTALDNQQIEGIAITDSAIASSPLRLSPYDTRNNSHFLNYLEQFAQYLLNETSKTKTKFQQGLNLVLKAITNTTTRQTNNSQIIPVVTLPVTKTEFLTLLRKIQRSTDTHET